MKGSERVLPPKRIPKHGAGYLLFPARWWKACPRAPAPPQVAAEIRQTAKQNQTIHFNFIKSQDGLMKTTELAKVQDTRRKGSRKLESEEH